MKTSIPIYIGTVCLEKNRWGSREPSFKISEWAERFAEDGFEGIELWEFHYLLADESEKEQLCKLDIPIVYNSYANFADEGKESQLKAAQAIKDLRPEALKYNLGHDKEKLDEYRCNLLKWADLIPSDCKLLCECHQGTVLEDPDFAGKFFADLPAERFGVMVHPITDAEKLKQWFDVFGERVCELHFQFRTPESDPSVEPGCKALEKAVTILQDYEFSGVATIEFTRGIGKDEDIRELYANACSDMQACRKMFA